MKTNRITLRPFREEDLESIQKLGNNPTIASNLRDGFPHPYTMEDAKLFLELAMNADPINRFAILENDVHVGNIGLHLQTDIYRKSAEIGYFVGEPYWNRGIATEAVKLIVEYGFREWDINRIFAGVFSYNLASARVLEKAGFVYEGTFKNAVTKNGESWDEIRYAILKP